MRSFVIINRIFPKVDYPNDRRSIEHIIKEYDKKLDHLLGLKDTNKWGQYIAYIMSISIMFYIIKCYWVSIFIRLLYIIPCAISVIYNIILILQVKKNKENKKNRYELKNFEIIFICMFIYIGTFLIESILFNRSWKNESYLIWFVFLGILSMMAFIIARINAPKKFIKKFQYQESKLYTPSSILASITSLLVSIAYFHKPYYLILIGSYILLVVMSALVTYLFFVYRQYDKIQELKKEINYISKEKK